MTDHTVDQDSFYFGRSFVVPGRRELTYDGAIVEIGDRAFDLLVVLIEARGAIVSKLRLMTLVWPGRIVEENTLESQMSILRRALGDDRRAIRTIACRGYQFVGDVQAAGHLPLSPQQSQIRCVNLPASLSALIGRDTALREITELAASHRLVTLVGAGGVGKTRLAIESARQLGDRFPDRVCLAELAATTTGEYLPMTIARAFGFPPGECTPLLDRITASIQDKQILLVLDNCEHLIEDVARITQTFLNALPHATVIATSREALRIAGEYVYRVASLEVPPADDSEGSESYGAVQLFRERIGAEIFGFRRVDHLLALEARICRRLDGIPLAIELAAACVSVFGLQGVADRLADRFQLLTHGMRTALPRQQTLRATLDWSYDLLSSAEQIVLTRLSIFADSFSLVSAEAVVSSADMVPETVSSCIVNLINKSLISPSSVGESMRYRMLETTRAYARDKLHAGGELAELSGRHARHYLTVFRQAESEAEFRADVDWNATYGPHLEDLRAAISWSLHDKEDDAQIAVALTIASVTLSMRLALIEECLATVNASLAWLDSATIYVSDGRMKLYAARGACLLYQTAGAETGMAFKAALELAEALGNVEYQMRGIWGCWSHSYLNGSYADALTFAYRFEKLAFSSQHASDELVANRLIGIAHLYLGQLDYARIYLERTLERQALADPIHRLRFLYDEKMLVNTSLSHTLLFQGFPDQSIRVAEQAFENARELDHLPSLCFALSEAVCTAALTTGSDALLANAVAELVHATRRHGVSTWKARGLMWEAFIQLRADCAEAFTRVIKPALDEIGTARFFVTLTPLLSAVSQVLGTQGSAAEGLALITPAIGRAKQSGDECSLVELMRAKGELLLLAQSQVASVEAEKLLTQALALAHQRGFLTWELRCATSLARLWHSHGKSQEGHDLLWGVYHRFSEGWSTADLVAARTLITTLSR